MPGNLQSMADFITHATEDELTGALQFFDHRRLRPYYAVVILELRAELARRRRTLENERAWERQQRKDFEQ